MDKKQQFRTEFLTLCDEYEIDASEMSIEFLNKAYDIAIPLGAEVRVKIAEEIDDAIETYEKIKAKYLDKNLERYIRAGGSIFALQTLKVDLDNLFVRLQASNFSA